MAGPWEKYQAPARSAPWARYKADDAGGLNQQQMDALARARARHEAGGPMPAPHNAPEYVPQDRSFLRQVDDAVRGVADVATLGFSDEIAAKLSALTGVGGREGDYEGNLGVERARDAEGGLPRIGGQVAGALLSPMSAAKTAAGALGQGALLGGAYGFGSGEGGLEGRRKSAVVGTALGGTVGLGAHKVADAFIGRAARAAIPTASELKATSKAGYEAADAAGVIVKPEGIARVAAAIKGDLTDFGYLPKLQPRIGAFLEEADRLATGNTTFKGVDVLRRVAKNAAASSDPSEAAMGTRIAERVGDYMENLPAEDVLTGNADAAASGIRQGRENWARFRRNEMVDTARIKAERRAASTGTGGNLENAIRQNVRGLLDNPKKSRGMTPAEIEMAETVVRGTPTQNAARLVGRLSPTTGGLSAMMNVGATALNPWFVIPGGIGIAAKTVAEAMTTKNANALSEMIRSGGSTAKDIAARATQGIGPDELVDAVRRYRAMEAKASPMAALMSYLTAGGTLKRGVESE